MNQLNRCKPLLGTYVEINLAATCSDNELINTSNAMFAAIEAVDTAMSFHQAGSELSLINRCASHQSCPLSADMETVLQQALLLSQQTQGLFDISVAPTLIKHGLLPDSGLAVNPNANWENIHIDKHYIHFSEPLLIDLGGIAKGFAVDQAFKALGNNKAVDATVNAGGDMRMSHWHNKTIGVRHPQNPSMVIETPMHAACIATSAGYYLDAVNAIITPATAEPTTQHHSVSVFANSCMVADALTKVAALEFKQASFYSQLNAEVLFIDTHGTTHFL